MLLSKGFSPVLLQHCEDTLRQEMCYAGLPSKNMWKNSTNNTNAAITFESWYAAIYYIYVLGINTALKYKRTSPHHNTHQQWPVH